MWEIFRNIVPLSSLNPEEEEKKNMSFYEEKKKRKLHEEIETEKEKRIKLEKEIEIKYKKIRKLEKEIKVLRKFVPVFQLMKELRPWEVHKEDTKNCLLVCRVSSHVFTSSRRY